MLLFIRMIPRSVTSGELDRFVRKGMGSFWTRFLVRQEIAVRPKVIRITNRKTHSVEYHGIVDIEPATSAQAAIRRLNRTRLKGKRVEVRHFFRRSPLRDRRVGHLSVEHDSSTDIRSRDRRRNQLVIEPVSVSGAVEAGDSSSVHRQINWDYQK